MVKGRFSIFAGILHFFLVAISAVAFWQVSPFMSSEMTASDRYVLYCAVPLYIIFTIYALVSPFVNLKNVIIDDISITYRYMLRKKSFRLKDIEGYFTMELPSRDTTYETIYPVSSNRILPPVSSFYISNYDQVKKAMPLKNMGKVRFSLKNYFVILFTKKYTELNR